MHLDTWMMLAAEPWTAWSLLRLAVLIGLIVTVTVLIILMIAFGKLWIQAIVSRADVQMKSLVGMYFRQVRMQVIVNAKIMAAQSGLDIDRTTGISTQRLEAHYLAVGMSMTVMQAIIAADRAQIDLDFDKACAIDLAGRDVLMPCKPASIPKLSTALIPNEAVNRP